MMEAMERALLIAHYSATWHALTRQLHGLLERPRTLEDVVAYCRMRGDNQARARLRYLDRVGVLREEPRGVYRTRGAYVGDEERPEREPPALALVSDLPQTEKENSVMLPEPAAASDLWWDEFLRYVSPRARTDRDLGPWADEHGLERAAFWRDVNQFVLAGRVRKIVDGSSRLSWQLIGEPPARLPPRSVDAFAANVRESEDEPEDEPEEAEEEDEDEDEEERAAAPLPTAVVSVVRRARKGEGASSLEPQIEAMLQAYPLGTWVLSADIQARFAKLPRSQYVDALRMLEARRVIEWHKRGKSSSVRLFLGDGSRPGQKAVALGERLRKSDPPAAREEEGIENAAERLRLAEVAIGASADKVLFLLALSELSDERLEALCLVAGVGGNV